MKSRPGLGHRLAILACVASLAGTAIAVAPPAASARAASTCADKSLAIKTEAGQTLHITVKAISIEGGVSCAEAYKVIAGGLEGKPLPGWKTASAHFEAPEGLVPELAKKGSKKIKFAVSGG
ncbi:MAG: hypothetical protein JSS68_06695 [Actinobacteria bacterium]|nr:hypothetical protein [Actinomycetota bacterium]